MGLDAAAVQESPEGHAARADLVAAAGAELDHAGRPGAVVRDLYGRVPPDDLAPYDPQALASLAGDAYHRLKRPRRAKSPPEPRLVDVTVARDGRPQDLTLVEVVNDNRPFLLDSTLMALDAEGLSPLLVAHPILGVARDDEGLLRSVVGETTAEAGGSIARESLIHIHLDRIDDGALRERLLDRLQHTYADVALASDDAEAMAKLLDALVDQARRSPAPAPDDGEALAFLSWLHDGHFTTLGMAADGFAERLDPPFAGAALGLLRAGDIGVSTMGGAAIDTLPEIVAFREGPQALIVTKASRRSRVHRPVHLDYVVAKLFEADGALAGEMRIVGLFAASAYSSPTSEVPYLRRKVAEVQRRAGLDPTSHAGRTFADVLENYPRDDLFQIDTDRLLRFALAILALAERPRIRVLSRPDRFGRFVSLLVYVPKDRYDATVRARIGACLAEALGGRVSLSKPDYPEGALARTHFIIGLNEQRAPERDPVALEAEIARIVRTWGDGLRETLAACRPGREARSLAARYAEAFSVAYREGFAPADALADIAVLERLSEAEPRAVRLGRREGDLPSQVRLAVFSHGQALALSDRVPALENFGFEVLNERTYRITPAGESCDLWLYDMLLARSGGGAVDLATVSAPLEAAMLAIGARRAESDGYNRLVLDAGLDWREAALMRTFGRYLRQLRIRYGQDYLAATLARHASLAAKIVALFQARFDPDAPGDREAAQAAIRAEIEEGLGAVTSLDDDRILRRFVNLVEAAIRTSFFQRDADGNPRETIALKFACAKITAMPLPRPLFEIFLSSPRVEGLHLRFGYVARGGLRWTDRPEDFRTEILGLVKAQQVKNAVIVPVGAKGGFFPQRLPPASDRAAWLAEGTESYRLFIRTLLDLTDNIVDGAIVPPARTVRHDPDDAYLVVAADKGTATFSDVANAISIERHHWLGDAFASGGSQGYDHKAMGITARGAWEAVKRHFREIDVDPQRDPVTVVGVGDMSGDVFGNGMLLSESLRLVAAFDHRDIFLDPVPDAARSFVERERLFKLPRSSWADYDKALISPGGGVFSRNLKAIPLSEPVRAALGIEAAEASPADLMRAILEAPADLLWFGGIGTYVRAATETDDEAGDRANDPVRTIGGMLRAKVVGEGANLGLTQRGRIEAARAGVRLNTDAIDNSAGVNTSDVEVNIKIALMIPERDGRLDPTARNALLAEMTQEVGALVLRNNALQTLALSLVERRGVAETGFAIRTMAALEARGRLDRSVEFLPDDATLAERERRGEGLTRPEWAVLLAYAKLWLYDEILASDVPDDPYFDRELQRYFPQALKTRFPDAVEGHRLRREIIATALSNIIVNRGGPTLVARLMDETGADAAAIAKAYAATRDAYGLLDLNLAIDRLDGALPGQDQLGLYAEVQDLLADRITWFIRNLDLGAPLKPLVARYADGVAAVAAALPAVLDPEAWAEVEGRRDSLVALGMAEAPAFRLAAATTLESAPDIVRVGEGGDHPIADVAATHFAIEHLFRLDALERAARNVPVADPYDHAALAQAVAGIGTAHRALTAEVLGSQGAGAEAVAAWAGSRGPALARIRGTVEGIAASGLTVSKAVVAASLLGEAVRR